MIITIIIIQFVSLSNKIIVLLLIIILILRQAFGLVLLADMPRTLLKPTQVRVRVRVCALVYVCVYAL